MARDRFLTTIEIKGAQIVAAVKDDGVIIERRDIVFREGCEAQLVEDGEDELIPALEYTAFFDVKRSPDPVASEAVEARMVIEGDTSEGRIEIRDPSGLGRDDFCNGVRHA